MVRKIAKSARDNKLLMSLMKVERDNVALETDPVSTTKVVIMVNEQQKISRATRRSRAKSKIRLPIARKISAIRDEKPKRSQNVATVEALAALPGK